MHAHRILNGKEPSNAKESTYVSECGRPVESLYIYLDRNHHRCMQYVHGKKEAWKRNFVG